MSKRENDIGIILPTRGLVFTEVQDAIEKMRQETWRRIKVYYSYDKKIPDCLNTLVSQALSENITHLLFIEEDTVPPDGALTKLINPWQDIAYIDYGVNGWSCSAKDSATSKTLWCGFGCTMIKRNVFEKVEKPWFRTDKTLRLNTMEWIDNTDPERYGGHDIWFFSQAREKGCSFYQVEGECKHLKLDALGQKERNYGLHSIGVKSVIERQQIINLTN